MMMTRMKEMPNLNSAKAITFLDIETTHLESDKSAVLEITMITDWADGRSESWTSKIKPKSIELEFASQEALAICKYSEVDWSDAPPFESVAETIASKLMFGPIVGHNVQFDIDHLNAAFRRYGWKKPLGFQRSDPKNKIFKPGYPLIDTCAMAYVFLPTEKQNLNFLREHYGLDTSGAHTSKSDAEDCRQIFFNIINDTLGEN